TGQVAPARPDPLPTLRYRGLPPRGAHAEAGARAGRVQVEPGRVDRIRRGHVPERRLDRPAAPLDALDDPLEDAGVLAEAGPQEPAVVAAAEPVHVEDPRQRGRGAAGALADL